MVSDLFIILLTKQGNSKTTGDESWLVAQLQGVPFTSRTMVNGILLGLYRVQPMHLSLAALVGNTGKQAWVWEMAWTLTLLVVSKLTSGSTKCLIYLTGVSWVFNDIIIWLLDTYRIIYISDTVIFKGIVSFLTTQYLLISKHPVSIQLVCPYPIFSYFLINSDLSTGGEVQKSKQ